MVALEFHLTGPKGERRDPEWKEMEAINARCPKCSKPMFVAVGSEGLLYALCEPCQAYYRGE